MARLAIFIDGGYLAKLAEHHFRVWVDFEKLSSEARDRIAASTQEPLDLLRTYFYDCLPYQSDPPSDEEARRFGGKGASFRDYIVRLTEAPGGNHCARVSRTPRSDIQRMGSSCWPVSLSYHMPVRSKQARCSLPSSSLALTISYNSGFVSIERHCPYSPSSYRSQEGCRLFVSVARGLYSTPPVAEESRRLMICLALFRVLSGHRCLPVPYSQFSGRPSEC